MEEVDSEKRPGSGAERQVRLLSLWMKVVKERPGIVEHWQINGSEAETNPVPKSWRARVLEPLEKAFTECRLIRGTVRRAGIGG